MVWGLLVGRAMVPTPAVSFLDPLPGHTLTTISMDTWLSLGMWPHLLSTILPFFVLSPILTSRAIVAIATLIAATAAVASVPPPASAYFQKIVVDPNQPSTLYAASPGAGLYRSLDGGDSWVSISPGEDLRQFNTIVVDPEDGSRLFTGGKESGLWYSADQGETWERIGLENDSILDLAMDPMNPRRIFALVPNGVRRTDDVHSGRWVSVFDYDAFLRENRVPSWPPGDWQMTRFQGLSINPHEPQVVAIGARWEGGYHLSTDGGENWSHQPVGPLFRRVDRLVFDPVDPSVQYAATHHQGVFKSYNGGASWISSSTGIEPQKRTPHYGAVLVSGMAFDPNDPRTIYSGSDYSNWKSIDGGRTWDELGITLTCEFARSFAVAPGEPETVYAGTNVGIYRSRDRGATWESCNRGLPEREIIHTCIAEMKGEAFAYAVVRGRPAVFRRSITRDTDWVSMSWVLYENARSIRFEPSDGVLVLETDKGIRRSSDGGFRWDVEPTLYAERAIVSAAAPIAPPDVVAEGHRRILIAITGAAAPDDSVVDALYQRPPYVSLQVVGSGYPLDGSTPTWSGFWESRLSGAVDLPEELIRSDGESFLYVEVRDFQWGTLVGRSRIDGTGTVVVEVEL